MNQNHQNGTPTVDGCEIHFAPPKKPWNNDSPVNTNKRHGFNLGFKGGAKWISQPPTVGVLFEVVLVEK